MSKIELKLHQRIGVDLMLNNIKNSLPTLLADEQGVGKTYQVLEVVKQLKPNRVLIVCPLNAIAVWNDHILSYGFKHHINIVSNNFKLLDNSFNLITYDRVKNLRVFKQIKAMPQFDIAIYDEFHYLKGGASSQRSKVFMIDLYNIAKYKIGITGTPAPHSNKDYFALLKILDVALLGKYSNYRLFMDTFAPPKKFSRGGITNTNTNLLCDIASKVTIRRLKKDVLKDLPPKQYEVITLDTGVDELCNFDLSSSMNLIDIRKALKGAFGDLLENTLNRLDRTLDIVLKRMQVENNKVVLFAWNKQVIDEMVKYFVKHLGEESVVKIDGSVQAKHRGGIAKEFQENAKVKVFIGNIGAASTSISLTTSNRLYFVQCTYSAGDMSQAMDRIHRFGQSLDCLISFIVAKNSVDEFLLTNFIGKDINLKQLLGDKNE